MDILRIAAVLIVLSAFISAISAEIRINEVELNPEGTDTGLEWIELYSSSQIELINYSLVNSDNGSIFFNANFTGYYVYNFSSQFLDNSDERVSLKDNGTSLIFETPILADSENNNKTWQYCNGNWNLTNSTFSRENNCSVPTSPQITTPAIKAELEWDEEEIINNEEFEIDVYLYNLESKKYDFKLWIEDSDEKIISERYSEEDESWRAGNYYLNEITEGSGNKTIDVSLRLKEAYKNLTGEFDLIIKIRESSTEREILEDISEIEINEPEETEENTELPEEPGTISADEDETEEQNGELEPEETVILGSTQPERKENSIIYKSRSEYIKEYSLYAFSILCIIIITVLVFRKAK